MHTHTTFADVRNIRFLDLLLVASEMVMIITPQLHRLGNTGGHSTWGLCEGLCGPLSSLKLRCALGRTRLDLAH